MKKHLMNEKVVCVKTLLLNEELVVCQSHLMNEKPVCVKTLLMNEKLVCKNTFNE